MQKRGFETDQKCFRDFEIVLKFFETHVFFNKYLATFLGLSFLLHSY